MDCSGWLQHQEIILGGIDSQQLLLILLGPGEFQEDPGRKRMWGLKARLGLSFFPLSASHDSECEATSFKSRKLTMSWGGIGMTSWGFSGEKPLSLEWEAHCGPPFSPPSPDCLRLPFRFYVWQIFPG